MYPDLQDVVSAWEFEVKFNAAVKDKNNNFENEVKNAVGKFNTVENIKNYNPKVASNEQISAYANLSQVSDEYNLTLEQLLDELVKLGLLSSQPKEDLIKKLINELTADAKSAVKDSKAVIKEDPIEQFNPEVVVEWVKGLNEEEAKLANSKEFEQALTKQKEELKGAALSAQNYTSALQEVKDSQNNITDETATPKIDYFFKSLKSTGFEESLKKIKSAYDETFSDNGIQFSSMEDLSETFKNAVPNIEQYINTLLDSKSSAADMRNALINLTQEYINHKVVSGELTNQDEKLISAMLKSVGITNADEMATAMLTKAQERLRGKLDEAAESEIQQVLELAKVTEETNKTGDAFCTKDFFDFYKVRFFA